MAVLPGHLLEVTGLLPRTRRAGKVAELIRTTVGAVVVVLVSAQEAREATVEQILASRERMLPPAVQQVVVDRVEPKPQREAGTADPDE
jgi:hypothetical protein